MNFLKYILKSSSNKNAIFSRFFFSLPLFSFLFKNVEKKYSERIFQTLIQRYCRYPCPAFDNPSYFVARIPLIFFVGRKKSRCHRDLIIPKDTTPFIVAVRADRESRLSRLWPRFGTVDGNNYINGVADKRETERIGERERGRERKREE